MVAPIPRAGADGAAEGHVGGGVEGQPQVGQGVLDLAPLVEPDAADDDVRDPGPAQGVLQDPRLGVGAVEDGLRVPRDALPAHRERGLGHEVRLLVLVPGPVDTRRLAGHVVRPERLLLALDVVGDDGGGEREDPLGRPVVLLEPHDPGARVVVLEVEDVGDVRPAPLVDRLIRIADHAHVAVLGGEQADHPVLGAVGVLVLVHEDVAPQAAVPGEHLGHLGEEPDRAQEQIVEVHGPRLVQPLLVARVDERGLLLPRPPGLPQGLRHRHHLVLPVGDAVDGRRGRERAVGELALLHALLDEREPVVLVVDREVARQGHVGAVLPEHAHAHRVEGGDERGPQAGRQHEVLHAAGHLPRRLVREGHGEEVIERRGHWRIVPWQDKLEASRQNVTSGARRRPHPRDIAARPGARAWRQAWGVAPGGGGNGCRS